MEARWTETTRRRRQVEEKEGKGDEDQERKGNRRKAIHVQIAAQQQEKCHILYILIYVCFSLPFISLFFPSAENGQLCFFKATVKKLCKALGVVIPTLNKYIFFFLKKDNNNINNKQARAWENDIEKQHTEAHVHAQSGIWLLRVYRAVINVS